MRPFIALFTLLLIASSHSAHATQRNLTVTKSAGEQKRVALVIGNAAYKGTSPLRNPVNDARAMSNALNELGFQVIEVTDASQKEMNRAITTFGSKLNAETVALFFYAGHGLQVKGKNYIVPVDAQIETESAIASEAVSVDAVLEHLNSSPISIVILDACRNNPFERSFRKMGGGGLAQMDAPKGSFIAYATAPGKTANDGDGKNGLFTQELLKQINEPGLDLEKVFKRVRASVATKSNDAQMPWDSSSMTGEFYFKPGTGTQVASLEPVPTPTAARIKGKEEIEQETWESARDSSNIDAIQEYLKQYPKGRFVGQAKVLIATLKTALANPVEPMANLSRNDPDATLWAEAQKGNTVEDYQVYLDSFPKGKYIPFAKARIKKIAEAIQAVAKQQEQQTWDTAQQENSEASYGLYLKAYPTGRFAGLAKVRNDKLKNDIGAKEEAELWNKADSSNGKAAIEAYLNRYPIGRYIAAANAKLKLIQEEEAKGPEMVHIPSKNYEIGKYVVTQAEWKAIMGNNPSKFTNCGETCPVEQVNWDNAQAFIQKLNAKTGKQYRLPTEAEWEYACHGGSESAYCGGNDVDAVAWTYDNSNRQTHPVGQKQANGYGLYDMTGNVWEWMSDCWNGDCAKRVVRGGSWGDRPMFTRASSRYGYDPAYRDSFFHVFGFRLARTLS